MSESPTKKRKEHPMMGPGGRGGYYNQPRPNFGHPPPSYGYHQRHPSSSTSSQYPHHPQSQLVPPPPPLHAPSQHGSRHQIHHPNTHHYPQSNLYPNHPSSYAPSQSAPPLPPPPQQQQHLYSTPSQSSWMSSSDNTGMGGGGGGGGPPPPSQLYCQTANGKTNGRLDGNVDDPNPSPTRLARTASASTDTNNNNGGYYSNSWKASEGTGCDRNISNDNIWNMNSGNESGLRRINSEGIRRDKDDGKSSGDRGRGSYRCGKCGVPKKGHVCPYQPKFKRQPNEPPPEMKCASTQVEMDEFLVLRRLNLEIQGFPESYTSESSMILPDNVGTESHPLRPPSSMVGTSPTNMTHHYRHNPHQHPHHPPLQPGAALPMHQTMVLGGSNDMLHKSTSSPPSHLLGMDNISDVGQE